MSQPSLSTLFPYTTLFRSLFTLHAGEPQNAHLGTEYLAVLETNHRTPYLLNLHYQDIAHSIILGAPGRMIEWAMRSEEHTSELQSRQYLVCRLLLEKKNTD